MFNFKKDRLKNCLFRNKGKRAPEVCFQARFTFMRNIVQNRKIYLIILFARLYTYNIPVDAVQV